MKSLLTSLWRHQFFTLSGGLVGANILTLATMPFLTRLYPTRSFGYFAVYIAISSIAGALSTLRLEYSVSTAETDQEASVLAGYALICIAAITALSGVAISLIYFSKVLTAIPSSISFWFETLASITLVGLLQVLMQIHFRAGTLAVISIRHLLERTSVVLFSFIFAALNWTEEGLILAQVIGSLVSVLVLWKAIKLRFSWSLMNPHARKIFKKYRDFPLKNLPSATLTLVSAQLPPILYSIFFSAKEIGYLSLAQRLLDSPTSLINNSLGLVYYRRMLQSTPNIRFRVYWRTLAWSIVTFAIPLSIAYLFAGRIIETLFGVAWRDSTPFLLALIPFSFFRLVFLIQQSLYVIIRRLDLDLMVSSGLFVMQLLGLGIGIYLHSGLLLPVSLSAAFASLAYVVGIAMLFWQVRSYSQ